MKLNASPVKAFALDHSIAVAQPHGLRLDGKFPDDARSARAALHAAGPDVLVVAAYGLLLPKWLLELPRLGALNIHASLLPRWRGAAPVQRAIEAGDKWTGVTIMQMDEGLDTGDMRLAEPVAIRADDTAATLTDRLGQVGGRLIVEALELTVHGQLPRTPQGEDGVTYARKIGKHEAAIDWTLAATAIERKVRAFDPFPGATFRLDGETVKLWRATVVAEPSRGLGASASAGIVVDAGTDEIAVACGQDVLLLKCLQRPGGRRLGTREFLASRPLPVGSSLAA
jgi:methionyl-tRNA formyltransferase